MAFLFALTVLQITFDEMCLLPQKLQGPELQEKMDSRLLLVIATVARKLVLLDKFSKIALIRTDSIGLLIMDTVWL